MTNSRKGTKTANFKSKLEDREQFTIKKLKKKRREKYLKKNKSMHLVVRHYDDLEFDNTL